MNRLKEVARTINKKAPIVTVRHPRALIGSIHHGVRVTDIDTWRNRNNAKPVSFTRKKVA